MGHDVTIFATHGLQGAELTYNGVRHLPRGKHGHGGDLLPIYFKKDNFDILITVQDNWVMPYKMYQYLPWYPWFPVDDDPVSPELTKTLVDEKTGKNLTKENLVYSRWGVEQLNKEGIQATYLPESVDINVFKDQGKDASKEAIGFDKDHFVVGVVAANHGYPMRKAFDRTLMGFAKFAEKHDNAMLYLHTNVDESWREHDAFDLVGLMKLLSKEYPVLEGRVTFPDQYTLFTGISDDKMAQIYSSFDVLLAASGAEGFGLPILEAQSCSRPVIVTDFSSMPEMLGAGWKVKIKDRQLLGRMSYQVWPDEDDIAVKLEEAYNSDLEKLGLQARKFAIPFDNPTIAKKYWQPLLNSIKL